ncbi:hypothetical protein [Gemmatimonas phototrophica]|uniref:hypothetical protein n=1 Tax=Gemmatimonas phototrophica TaxID=1379270 RepID=UPI0006A72B1B|nr:hypothetical protein [Gemmatimonas phototrophica]
MLALATAFDAGEASLQTDGVMYGTVIAVHNVLAWLVLAIGLMVLVQAVTAKATWGPEQTSWVRRLTLLVHLQFVAGLVLWFVSPTVAAARAVMGTTMKDAALRRLVVEHPTLMLLAVVAATVTSVMVRKAPSSETKAKKALMGTLLTLVLVAAVIPWQNLISRWTA